MRGSALACAVLILVVAMWGVCVSTDRCDPDQVAQDSGSPTGDAQTPLAVTGRVVPALALPVASAGLRNAAHDARLYAADLARSRRWGS